MKVDAPLVAPIGTTGRVAADLEAVGHAGAWTVEAAHDPFLPVAVAAGQTERLELGTSIAVAFARNPMLLANIGWDLQSLTGGRFVLGLGSQVRPHITKRFSMEWSHPAPRMRELILAIRAIWGAWLHGTPLAFRGRFYRHTLMTPFFTPDADDLAGFGPPRIFVAGVGELMTEVAGEVGDGFICHPFTTERYLRDVTLPALARGRVRAGLSLDGFEIVGPSFVVTGATDEQLDRSAAATRRQIAFYASTPAYRPVLDLHGWGDLHTELNALSKQGQWDAMGDLIDDEILDAFAIAGTPEALPAEYRRRYGDVVDRVSLAAPTGLETARWSEVVAALTAP